MRSSGIRARQFLVGSVIMMLASCSLVESLDDLTKGDCVGEACIDATTTTDAETSDDPGTPPPDDAGSSSDAGDAADSSAVDADDGADADAAPECPTLPSGWTSVRVAAEGAGCASGFKRTLVDNPRSASDACTCSCQAAPSNPCEYDGSYGFGFGLYGGSCNYSGNVITLGCQKNPSWNTGITSVSGTPRPPLNVTCPATTTRPALVNDAVLDVCASPAGAKTCGEGACILHEGTDAACLDGFPVRRELTDQEDIEDTRACSNSCSCQTKATACVDASFTLYTDEQCSAGGRTAVFDSTCKPFDSNFSPKSYQYRANPNVNGCEPASPTTALTGSVTSKKKVTLCCAGP